MKKPNIDEFTEALRKTGGNITQVASIFQVNRKTVHEWVNEDAKFKDALRDSRMRLFDQCLDSARILALGIPSFDSNGNVNGWKEKPDPQTVRYLLGTLGRDEGFGDQQNINISGSLPTIIKIIEDPHCDN